MSILDFTEDDLNRGKVVEPAWYRMQVGHLVEALSKDQKSTNWTYDDTKIIRNEETGDERYKGVIVPIRFNSKAKGFTIGFFTILMGEEIKPGMRVDMKAAEGKEIIAFIENDTYENRLVNKINHKYKAAKDDEEDDEVNKEQEAEDLKEAIDELEHKGDSPDSDPDLTDESESDTGQSDKDEDDS